MTPGGSCLSLSFSGCPAVKWIAPSTSMASLLNLCNFIEIYDIFIKVGKTALSAKIRTRQLFVFDLTPKSNLAIGHFIAELFCKGNNQIRMVWDIFFS